MLIKGKEVIGLNIVTVDTGSIIETIKDVAYNPTTQRIEALFVSNGGLFSSAKAIYIDDVHSIGQDAAIVADRSVVVSVKQLPEVIGSIAHAKKYLVNTKVLTVEGRALGRVSDIIFDSHTGYVNSMEVSQGGLKTLTEGKKSIRPIDIVTIGADTTIVSAFTEIKLEAQGEQNGLKGAVNDAKAKVSDIAADTKEASLQLSERVQAATEEAGVELKRHSDDIADTVSDAYKDARTDARHKRSQAKRSIDQLAQKAEEVTEDVKKNAYKEINTLRRDSRKMVSQSKKAIENEAEQVEIKETKIVKKR